MSAQIDIRPGGMGASRAVQRTLTLMVMGGIFAATQLLRVGSATGLSSCATSMP